MRINPELKDEFKADTKENSEYGYGVTLAHALRAYRQGGRAKRLEERLGRVADDAEKFLSEFANTDGAENGISLRKKRTIAICNRLSDSQGSEFLESDLYDAIAAIAGDSKPTLQEYEKRVLDRLDVTPHPNNPDLWIPHKRADEIVNSTDAPSLDAPAIDRKDYADLSREEKVEGVQIELACESTTNGGKYQFDASTANQQMFDDNVSPGHIYDLMREAGKSEGFRFTDYNDTKVLRVDLDDVTEQAVIDTLKSDSEAESDGGEKETEGEEQTRANAESQMDALMNAEVATDGGRPE